MTEHAKIPKDKIANRNGSKGKKMRKELERKAKQRAKEARRRERREDN